MHSRVHHYNVEAGYGGLITLYCFLRIFSYLMTFSLVKLNHYLRHNLFVHHIFNLCLQRKGSYQMISIFVS